MADANSVTSGLATLGASGWVPNASWAAQNAVPVTPAVTTWANRALFQTQVGRQVRFSDVGSGDAGTGGGNVFWWSGTKWKPIGSNILLDAIDTPNTSIADATEQQLNGNHQLLPAGLINNGDRLLILLTASKNNTAETCTIRLRFGPTGTAADPVIATITTLAGANQSLGSQLEFKRLSATSLQKEGNADTSVSFGGAIAVAFPAPVAVSNMDSNAMYLSITSQMSVGAELCTIQNYTLNLFATDN